MKVLFYSIKINSNFPTGRKVHERKLSSLMKKMKDSCKLDIINQSVPENILSRPEVKRKQCGGDRYYQISGHNNVAFINNYSTLSEERHKKISNILSNTETNRMAVSPRTNFLYE